MQTIQNQHITLSYEIDWLVVENMMAVCKTFVQGYSNTLCNDNWNYRLVNLDRVRGKSKS